MYGFILCCLLLSYFVQSHSEFIPWVSSPASLYVGCSLIFASTAAGLSKRVYFALGYDGFAIGALLVWFSYWQQLFNADAPMFYLFPLYFALITAGATLLFLRRDEWLDENTMKALPAFSGVLTLPPVIIAAAVLVSIAIHKQFLVFPILMTLFIMRFVFSSYLDKHLSK